MREFEVDVRKVVAQHQEVSLLRKAYILFRIFNDVKKWAVKQEEKRQAEKQQGEPNV